MKKQFVSMPGPGRSAHALPILCAAVLLAVCLSGCGLLSRTDRGGDMACSFKEPVESVHIECESCDVRFSVGGGDACAVEYLGPSRMACTAEVKNGTLRIEEKRVHRLMFWNWFSRRSSKLTVFLPREEYDELELSTVSGDVDLDDGDLFRDVWITTVSGDIDLTGAGGGEAVLSSVSGDMAFRDGSARELSVSTTSGDVTVTGVDVAGRAELSTVSGDVALLDADAESLSISTTSGDVSTDLRTAKEYVTHTVSGDVSVASSQPGAGRCEIETISGEILCR